MPIREEADDMIDFLNSLVTVDAEAMQKLVEARVECGVEMANHPTVQVGFGNTFGQPDAEYVFGFIGVINGFFGAYDDGPREGYGAIGARFDDSGKLTDFFRITNL